MKGTFTKKRNGFYDIVIKGRPELTVTETGLEYFHEALKEDLKKRIKNESRLR